MATATVSPVAAHHYIRSIHTSFTSAHHAHAHAHASRPHAAAVSAFGGGMLGQHHSLVHNHNHHQQQQQGGYHHPHHTYNNGQGLHSGSSPHQAQNISISTHNAHMYAHHLRDLTVSSTPVTAATPNSQMRQVASQGPPLHHRPSRHQLHSQRQQQQNYHTGANGGRGQGQGQAKEQGVASLTGPVFTPPPLAGAKRALSPVYQQQQEQQYPMTRKRSSSIRGSVSPLTMTTPTTGMAAAATRKDQRGRSGSYRFDPFADEDVDIGVGENERAKPIESVSAPASYPYTIQIPAAGPSEIERYTGAGTMSAPVPRATTTATMGSRPLSPRAAEFTPTRSPSPPKSASPGLRSAQPPYPRSQPQSTPSVTQFRSTTPTQATETSTPTPTLTLTPKSTPAPRPTPKSTPMPTPNLSKIVAGILLNRVHAVGKPMRRRIVYADPCVSVRYTNANAAAGLAEGAAGARAGAGAGRGYVKSCLSRVVSVEC